MRATIEGQRRLGRRQLEVWLAGGVRDSRRFVLAVLRDMYPDDHDVSEWLNAARPELNGACANDLLSTPRTREVETLAVRDWNAR